MYNVLHQLLTVLDLLVSARTTNTMSNWNKNEENFNCLDN